jgi:UPF0042 nucleotide-binding protein
MEFCIVSGLSGAGKSRVANILEDLDFYCVDNMPVVLMPIFAELCMATKGRYDKVALVTDVRGVDDFSQLFTALDRLQEMGVEHKILFVEATDRVILKRYKETRRRHPLDPDGRSLEEAIARERELLAPVRARASFIVDSSEYSLSQLQHRITDLLAEKTPRRGLHVNVVSFGFKYGLPGDADLVFDVRFLPNPYYVVELAKLSGLDKPVKDFLFGHEQTKEFMERLTGLIGFLLPLYVEEGKPSLVIAVGCTGGHHRSVAVAEALAEFAAGLGYAADCRHRDVGRS